MTFRTFSILVFLLSALSPSGLSVGLGQQRRNWVFSIGRLQQNTETEVILFRIKGDSKEKTSQVILSLFLCMCVRLSTDTQGPNCLQSFLIRCVAVRVVRVRRKQSRKSERNPRSPSPSELFPRPFSPFSPQLGGTDVGSSSSLPLLPHIPLPPLLPPPRPSVRHSQNDEEERRRRRG